MLIQVWIYQIQTSFPSSWGRFLQHWYLKEKTKLTKSFLTIWNLLKRCNIFELYYKSNFTLVLSKLFLKVYEKVLSNQILSQEPKQEAEQQTWRALNFLQSKSSFSSHKLLVSVVQLLHWTDDRIEAKKIF